MSKSKDAPETQAVPDPTLDELKSWGLSGRGVRMAPADWVPVVQSLRDANLGKQTATTVQPILDTTFPGRGYQATALINNGIPRGTFTFSPQPPSQSPTRTFTSDDKTIGLPFEHYQWDFGDGFRDAGPVVKHTYLTRGAYTVTHTVTVAGQPWSSTQTVRPLGGPLPTVTSVSPRGAVIGGPDVTVTVRGTGFVAGKTHLFAGDVERACTVVSDTELTTVVDASNPIHPIPGTLPVSVNVDTVGRSNAVGFDVLPAGSSQPTTTQFAEPDEPKPPKDDDKIVVEGEVVGTREEPEPQVMQGGGDVLMPGEGLPESEPGTIFAAEQPEPEVEDKGYEPGDHTIDEVLRYLKRHPDQVGPVTAREERGKARGTLLEKLNAMSADATT